MKARFLIENPGEVEFTTKITMTANEWEELRDQLTNGFPSWQLSNAISVALASVRKIHWMEQEAS